MMYTWHYLGQTVSDRTHRLFYHGAEAMRAYSPEGQIWEKQLAETLWRVSTTEGSPAYNPSAVDTSTGAFRLVTQYHYDGTEASVNEGYMAVVDMDTTDFSRVESISIGEY